MLQNMHVGCCFPTLISRSYKYCEMKMSLWSNGISMTLYNHEHLEKRKYVKPKQFCNDKYLHQIDYPG